MTIQEAFKEFCKQYVTPNNRTCAAMAIGDNVIQVTASGDPDMLSDLAAGMLDKHQNGHFSASQRAMSILTALTKQAFGPQAQMSVSICVDGEWKRLTTVEELLAVLS